MYGRSALLRALFLCLCGLSVPVFAFNLDTPHPEELQLASAYVDVSSATTGGELLFPEMPESAHVPADFALPSADGKVEEAAVQQQATSSMLWLLVASVLGFSVVARRRSPE